MKKLFSKKWFKLLLAATALILVVVFIVIPFVDSVKWNNEHAIKNAMREIIDYPDIEDDDSVKRAEEYMSQVTKSKKNTEKFEEQAVAKIKALDISNGGSVSYRIDCLTETQLMLEKVGYESPALKQAFEEKIKETVDLLETSEGFYKIPEHISNTDIDASSLTYYQDFKTMFLNDLAPTCLKNQYNEAVASGKTSEFISLCNNLAAMSEFLDFDADSVVSVDNIIKNLTTDAEEIIVKDGEGGYYDNMKSDASQDNKSDELFDYVASTITGLDVNSNSFKFKNTKYYGDLSSYYFESGLAYSYEDEDGKTQYNSNTNKETRIVFLKGEPIHEGNSVDKKFIKYAYEDGMINYHKDGFCFAVGNSSLTCYVGNETFLMKF